MDINKFEKDFKKSVCDQISLKMISEDKYRVITPFQFDDGDHLKIVLKKVDNDWVLSDEGHTLMHLNYYIDENQLFEGIREKILFETVENMSLDYDNGRISSKINKRSCGKQLLNLVQGLIQINDVLYVSRADTSKPFLDDVKSFIFESVASNHIAEDWAHPEHDHDREFVVDFNINGMNKPLLIFRLGSNYRVLKATITLMKFEKVGFLNQSIGIYRDLDDIASKNKKVFSRLCDVEFTHFYDQKEDIVDYLAAKLPQGYMLSES